MAPEAAREINPDKPRAWPEWVVLVTAYVLGTSLVARIVFLFSNGELIASLDAAADLLLEGGVFATLVYLIRRRVPDRLVDGFNDRRRRRSRQSDYDREQPIPSPRDLDPHL